MRWPEPRTERARLPATPETLNGQFTAWGVTRRLDLQRSWEAPDLGRSWIYLAHYFDGLPALARTEPQRAGEILRLLDAWITAHPPSRAAAWDPYPTAVRMVNWVDTLQALDGAIPSAARERIAASLWMQTAWLRHRLEHHLLGTHLVKDLKAMLLAARVFEDERARAWGRRAEEFWRREIAVQVQSDGAHVESSLMYHGLALGDLLDVLNWRLGSEDLQAETTAVAQRMVDFLAAVQTPAGEYPLFGDAGADAVPPPRALLDYAARLGLRVKNPALGLTVHSDSGYVVWRSERQYVIAKTGGIGAGQIAAHAHCDALSFEWHVDGIPLVVDSGVQSYEPGPRRFASRCTRAHNTLQIDGREQHEIWAAFRVARRSRVKARVDGHRVEASLIPWHARRVEARRTFEFGRDGFMVTDRVTGPGRHHVASRLHFHPAARVTLVQDVLRIQDPRVEIRCSSQPALGESRYCGRMGVAEPNVEVAFESGTPFASRLQFRIEA
jgi:uncharacterized heparinase superfamily protein